MPSTAHSPPSTSTAVNTTSPPQAHNNSFSPNGNPTKKNNKKNWKPLPLLDTAKTTRSNSSKPIKNPRRSTQSTRDERGTTRDRERTRDENSENRPVGSRTVRTNNRIASNRNTVSSNFRGRSRGGFTRQNVGRRGIYRSGANVAGVPAYAFAPDVLSNQTESQLILNGTHYYNAVPTRYIDMDALSLREAIRQQV